MIISNTSRKQVIAFILVFTIIASVPLLISRYKSRLNTIDELSNAMIGVKEILPANSKILFKSNEEEYDRYLYQTQFILSPILISARDTLCDTIISLERRGEDVKRETFNLGTVLLKKTSENFVITLYKK